VTASDPSSIILEKRRQYILQPICTVKCKTPSVFSMPLRVTHGKLAKTLQTHLSDWGAEVVWFN
jgi:hypothetical protein